MRKATYKFGDDRVNILSFGFIAIFYVFYKKKYNISEVVMNWLTSILRQQKILNETLAPHCCLIKNQGSVEDNFSEENSNT